MNKLLVFLKIYKTPILFLFIFFIGVSLGFILFSYLQLLRDQVDSDKPAIYSTHREGNLTSPILDCELYDKNSFSSLKPLENRISQEINESKRNPVIREVAYYYREMKNGGWVGIDEKMDFAPASLLKVPLMMAIYKKAEKEPDVLNREMEYIKDATITMGLTQNIVPSIKLEKGKKYAVNEILHSMIVFSDNDAQQMIMDVLSAKEFDETYIDLGLEIPGIRQVEDTMSVRDYATFFRILYNASYLTREYSESALRLLAKTEFDGLTAHLPPGTIVAHKFGERGYPDDTGRELKQLHDCGIVYHPYRPYLICVMTRGFDFQEQKKVIQTISGLTFEDLTRRASLSGN